MVVAELSTGSGKAPLGPVLQGRGRVASHIDANCSGLRGWVAFTMKEAHNFDVQVERDVQSAPSLPAAGCDLRSTGLVQGTSGLLCEKLRTMTDEPGESPPTKSKPLTLREFERAMRDMGYSQREAKTIANHGFKGMSVDDPVEDVSELAALIQRNTTLFERIERKLP